MTELQILGGFCVVTALFASVTEKPKAKLFLFFVEAVLGSLLLLAMSAEYLAFVVLGSGIMLTLLFVALASKIGWTQPVVEADSRVRWVRHVTGLLSGAGLSYFVARVFSEVDAAKQSAPDATSSPGASASVLGEAFLGKHYFLFELLGVFFLIFVIGIGVLMRGDSDENLEASK